MTCEDDGPGIPEIDLHRIFDPSFSTKSRGSGMGLAAARRAVEEQGGRLLAERSPRGGLQSASSFRRPADIIFRQCPPKPGSSAASPSASFCSVRSARARARRACHSSAGAPPLLRLARTRSSWPRPPPSSRRTSLPNSTRWGSPPVRHGGVPDGGGQVRPFPPPPNSIQRPVVLVLMGSQAPREDCERPSPRCLARHGPMKPPSSWPRRRGGLRSPVSTSTSCRRRRMPRPSPRRVGPQVAIEGAHRLGDAAAGCARGTWIRSRGLRTRRSSSRSPPPSDRRYLCSRDVPGGGQGLPDPVPAVARPGGLRRRGRGRESPPPRRRRDRQALGGPESRLRLCGRPLQRSRKHLQLQAAGRIRESAKPPDGRRRPGAVRPPSVRRPGALRIDDFAVECAGPRGPGLSCRRRSP